jgi:hypothetical protein
MSGTAAGRLAIALCVLIVVLLGLPYVVLDPGEISVYYGVGPVSPLYLAVLPAVVAVALSGALRGRTDQATASGASLAIAGLLTLFVLMWAAGVEGVIGGLTVTATFAYHPWVLAGASLALLFSFVGYTARALRG